MITIDQPIILSPVQNIQLRIISINIDEKGTYASLNFDVLDNNGVKVDSKIVEYRGAAYNEWWKGFNSGAYVYQQAFPQVQVSPSVEQEFLNPVPSVPVQIEPAPVEPAPVVEAPVEQTVGIEPVVTEEPKA